MLLRNFGRYFFSFKSSYGQAGKLNFNLTKATYDIKLLTIWEDHTEIEIPNYEQEFDLIEEQEGKLLQLVHNKVEQQPYAIVAKIPEYYSLESRIVGNLSQSYSLVDAKMLGDFKVEIHGNLNINKIKSQHQSIEIHQGQMKVEKYLESQNMLLLAYDSGITMKKFAISGPAEISLINSYMKINSFYAQIENQPFKSLRSTSRDYKTLQEQFRAVQQKSFINMYAHSSKYIDINNFNGDITADLKQSQQFKIGQLNNSKFIIKQDTGGTYLGLGENVQGVLSNPTGKVTLNIRQDSNLNIFDLKNQVYVKESPDSQATVYIESDSIDIIDTPFTFPQSRRKIQL